jgi:hypothetical protein
MKARVTKVKVKGLSNRGDIGCYEAKGPEVTLCVVPVRVLGPG